MERSYNRAKVKRRTLANINFIGELFKVGMLSSMVMHYCITTLLDKKSLAAPDEEKIELLCKLLMSVGDRLDLPPVENTKRMDFYAAMLDNLSRNTTLLSSKVRFMFAAVAFVVVR